MSMFSLTDKTIEEMKKNAGDIPGLDAWQKATESWIALMPEPMRAQAEAMANPLAAASAMSALGFATASQMMGLFMNNMNTLMELAEKEDVSSFAEKSERQPAEKPVPAAAHKPTAARKTPAKRSAARQPLAAGPAPMPSSPFTQAASAMMQAAETVGFDMAHAAHEAMDVTAHAMADIADMAAEEAKSAALISQEMIEEIMPEDFVPPRSLDKPASPDDLKLISGVGPKLEQVLNELGVWTFDQVAEWTAAEIAWVDDYLQFSGRILRDDWLGQAAKLAESAGAATKD